VDPDAPENELVYTPERREMHNQILAPHLARIKELAANMAPGQNPTLYILGGRGGSGKSSFSKMDSEVRILNPTKTLVVDPDEFKAEILRREFNLKEGEAPPLELAGYVHEESSQLADRLISAAYAAGVNIAVDKTLASFPGKLVEKFRTKNNGKTYRIEAHFMHVPMELSMANAWSRWYNGSKRHPRSGRLVMMGVIYSNQKNEENFDKLTKYVDYWTLSSGTRKSPIRPRRVLAGGIKT
jgi:predicted ABC-type ATPase